MISSMNQSWNLFISMNNHFNLMCYQKLQIALKICITWRWNIITGLSSIYEVMKKITIEVAVLRWKGLEKIYERRVVAKYNVLQIKSNH